ncbi:hypothetical protein [Streptomyces sp. NPDC096311]|uniref:hypothetical protein n=1 Tax=Streptomyces sp. NPDC096311 TaxID=3366083 RepID=UPI0037F8AAA0
MKAGDRTGPRPWSTTSPKDLDRLARGVLRAARDAAWELRRDPPDPAQQTWALGKLAGQTQAMLGPDLPDHPPLGAAAQEGFVRTALTLALHVRAHSWAEADLGAAGVPGQADVPHPGERRTADAFDVLGRLMLPHSSPDGWTATLVTDLARGDMTLEAAVKVGKYVLHPTFLALVDDATRVVGEALHNLHVRDLHELTDLLRHYASAAEPSHPAAESLPTPAVDVPAPEPDRPSVRELKPPDSGLRFRRHPDSPSARGRVDSEPVPADPATPASPQHPRHPRSPRSSKPESPRTPGPHRLLGPGAAIEPDHPPEFESPLDSQLTWQQPESDVPTIVSLFGGEDELGVEADVSPELDDPGLRGPDARGPGAFGL